MHGKNGIGRLTFHHFASDAIWKTTYLDGLLKNTYTIHIHSKHLDTYEVTNNILTDEEAGTIVTFNNIIKDFVYEDLLTFLCKEFGWFLELHSDKHFDVRLDGISLDYSCIIAEREFLKSFMSHTQTEFPIKYIRWEDRINHEYSKLYFIDSNLEEKHKQPTTFNNKGDSFYHSVYIQSKLFDHFDFDSEDQQGQQELSLEQARKKRCISIFT